MYLEIILTIIAVMLFLLVVEIRKIRGSIGEEKEKEEELKSEFAGDAEDLLDDAKEIILEARKVSTSYLQRKMRIGYNKAARIIDLLEEEEFLGPLQEGHTREILKDEYGDYLSEEEDIIEEAMDIVIKSRKASTSYLQRRMRIGYAKAALIMDILEKKGIIGPPEGPNKSRKILVVKE